MTSDIICGTCSASSSPFFVSLPEGQFFKVKIVLARRDSNKGAGLITVCTDPLQISLPVMVSREMDWNAFFDMTFIWRGLSCKCSYVFPKMTA